MTTRTSRTSGHSGQKKGKGTTEPVATLAGVPVRVEPGGPLPALAAFHEPERSVGLAWSPSGERAEMQATLLAEAMVPTLRYWAATLGRWSSPVRREAACYHAAEALRRALLDWWQRDRDLMPAGMLPCAWWQHLTDRERAVLTILAREGEQATPSYRAQPTHQAR